MSQQDIQSIIEENDKIKLNETEHSVKKKIFNLSKMEALVHSDPKLSNIYDQMAEGGSEKFGYHYNEMIMNVIFNDYILNDVNYLRKYRNSIAKKKKRRDKTGINKLRATSKPKSTEKDVVDETTGAASSGAFSSAAAWSSDGETHAKPAWKGGIVVNEKKETEDEAKEREVDFINDRSSEFGTVLSLRDKNDLNIIKNDIKTKKYDSANINNNIMGKGGIKEGNFFSDDTNFIINPSGFEKYVNMLNEEINSMATGETPKSMLKTRDSIKLREPLTQGTGNDGSTVDTPSESGEPIAESKVVSNVFTILSKTLDKDLDLLNSIKANEPKTLDDLNKIQNTNKTNAKEIGKNIYKDLQESLGKNATAGDYIKDFLDSTDPRFEGKTKEQRKKMALAAYYSRMDEARESNTYLVTGFEIIKDPEKLYTDLEKNQESKEALKNKGNIPSSNGKDVVKRNATDDELTQIELNRGIGLEDIVFDVDPGDKFKDKIKKEMGDDLYKSREAKLKFRAEQPLYNKEAQPVTNVKDKKTYSNKFEDNLKESLINGKYVDNLGNRRFTAFKLSEVTLSESVDKKWLPITFDGLGNMYNSVADMSINESTLNTLEENKYFFNEECGCVHTVKQVDKNISENRNLGFEKFRKLSGYKPNEFVDTKHTRDLLK